MKEDRNLTWDDIKAMYAENAKQLEKTHQMLAESIIEARQQRKESDQRLEKMYAESDARHEKQKKERNDEYEKRNKEWHENFEKTKQESNQRLAKLEKLIGGIGNNNGEMAEEFFFNAFRKDKIFMNEKYDKVEKSYFFSNDPYKGEYDIVFFNGRSVVIVEVKYKAKPNNIDIRTLTSRIERLKEYSPEYINHKFYLGVAAMSFQRGLASKLHRAGIVTIHPVGKKMVIYDKTLKAF